MQQAQKYSINALAWLIIFFYPAFQFILLVGFFVVADTVTGLIAAQKSGESISSKRFYECISKFAVYGIAILVAHVIQIMFFHEFPCLKLISGLVAFNELKSIDENIEKSTGKSLFKFFIKKLSR